MTLRLTTNRPVVLHHSALSELEFTTFIPEVYDIFEMGLPDPARLFDYVDNDFDDTLLDTNELRGWLKGRLRQSLCLPDIETILRILGVSAEAHEGLVAGQILAAFRLFSHCLDPKPKLLAKSLVWVPSQPNPTLWAARSPLQIPRTPVPTQEEVHLAASHVHAWLPSSLPSSASQTLPFAVPNPPSPTLQEPSIISNSMHPPRSPATPLTRAFRDWTSGPHGRMFTALGTLSNARATTEDFTRVTSPVPVSESAVTDPEQLRPYKRQRITSSQAASA
ncbi:hypothetical protein SISSUDRAFT_1036966 [Sistotremastrum suecicum HHB10207 ss-3]|uniref:Uncharacterized protein n=1 Tax=Sistotremastrum suecicum HHB10207 ss-3 TaxID=1314776 RepID=A0A165YSQ5_9AGAM|nr:hypothetical protein SISSUDRAFT_1036966 [Sistotremastrum suecicum HHB10207 ss-3]